MNGIVFFVVLLVFAAFVGGALFFRRHGKRIEQDANAVQAVAEHIADTTKKL